MHPILPQTAPSLPQAPAPATTAPVSTIPVPRHQDRITRLTALTPQDTTAGLLWLALNYPAVTDAMLDKIDYDAIDDPDPGQEPEPFCAACGANVGIFLRFGLDWHHYHGDSTTIGQIELFDPGHQPVVSWRQTRALVSR